MEVEMSAYNTCQIFSVVFLLFWNTAYGANNESVFCDNFQLPNNLPADYGKLENCRANVSTTMFETMYEISGLFTELERARKAEDRRFNLSQLNTPDQRDESASLAKKEVEQIDAYLNEIKSNLILPQLKSIGGVDMSASESIGVSEGLRRILENKVSYILKGTDSLNSIGSKVTELNNTEYVAANFKAKISWTFAGLVFVVIIGFFFIASRDEKIRRTIFSGEAGIQFLTLFSIVIAIILFGVTGVLEGKEITALIGGMSGYILGRSSTHHSGEKVV
jgi:hypothetical protein